ncbi:hypothetical protein [Sphingomonas sp.]|jgi:hypothetical protein|uniref:hypothetical protein n=1 Tax=Sphingomonas sp. TaxID=28214 RepID=UPI002612482B|nr:hypothetical protein [Sphingomonas sp.]MDF2495121.1 hypothetical protein [Sphingomonas sp.]
MRKPAALAVAAILAGCGQQASAPAEAAGAGAILETAAITRGVLADPAVLNPVGAFSSDSDRLCVVPEGNGYRIGVTVDYGPQQRCAARGHASGSGTLKIDLGGECRLEAKFDDERIVFPPALPAGCNQYCSGRATLSAVNATRLSSTATEARAMRSAKGDPLCD